MWSGPRNISTAMLRAWENRPDTWVVDEPLYAHYLTQVEVAHPGVAEVIAHHDSDWRRVVEGLTGPIPHGRAIYYQKHMAHHWLPHVRGEWVLGLTNCFLIRHPAEVLPSLAAKMGTPVLADTGLPQQRDIIHFVRERTGVTPPVVDAADVLENPEVALCRLYQQLGVAFSDRMLRWPEGPRDTDGIWGKYWYDAVWRSTGFEPNRPRPREVEPALAALLEECLPIYEELLRYRSGQA